MIFKPPHQGLLKKIEEDVREALRINPKKGLEELVTKYQRSRENYGLIIKSIGAVLGEHPISPTETP